MAESDTPRTDAEQWTIPEYPKNIADVVYVSFARQLERERSGLEAKVAELEAMIEDAKQDIDAMRKRHREEMNRYGCPVVAVVMSREDGHYLAHQIVSTHPTPDGLTVVIDRTIAAGD